ncbi:AAA-like domain-containing protein [Nostoc sp. FACHB-280]|uniref:AAA-like domain-containing protein n=1 Tax=Nostoc sp. FACHB-280 TaxID=2692839 RepID=UPI00168A8337|nr:AAA-like domain-containing protein [Nostoc sp. FACHB-280]MBD2493821.1 AAA-like domain-containing protein [Nostoc sp. FACHB-280]
MNLQQHKTKRRRGVVLTSTGIQRLQEAIISWEILKNQGYRLTLEELSKQVNISTKTLSRLWSLSKGVDQKTLKLCFSAFNLKLREEDYTVLNGENETKILDVVSKKSFLQKDNLPQLSHDQIEQYWSYPNGPITLDSPLYIERPPIEELVCREITRPGCVIRIRAPRQMGKSSLVLRLLAFANLKKYRTVNINCHQIDHHCLTDLNKLLRCLCWKIAQQLEIEPNLDDEWDEEVGYKLSCSFYLQKYILQQSNHPIVLVLNDVDRFFDYPHIAQEFFALLRSWCEEARQNQAWQKLRLVVVYSTEQYVSLDINRSPFNIGLPIRLIEFTQTQVEDLARRYELDWSSGEESIQLMSLVGGHPALIQLALYHLASGIVTLQELITDAIANGGIYRHHLWRHWIKLQDNPHLVEKYTDIVTATGSISVDPVDAYKLESLGLICFDGDRILPRCELYRNYFQKQLSIKYGITSPLLK